jgi:hypothetical protein
VDLPDLLDYLGHVGHRLLGHHHFFHHEGSQGECNSIWLANILRIKNICFYQSKKLRQKWEETSLKLTEQARQMIEHQLATNGHNRGSFVAFKSKVHMNYIISISKRKHH